MAWKLTGFLGASHSASKEANKQTAKDSDASIGSRVQSAGNAISDKTKEEKHNASAESNKQAATH